jgi:hypothetical protein
MVAHAFKLLIIFGFMTSLYMFLFRTCHADRRTDFRPAEKSSILSAPISTGIFISDKL